MSISEGIPEQILKGALTQDSETHFIQFLKGVLTQNSETNGEVHHEGERVPAFLSYSILKGSPYLEQ